MIAALSKFARRVPEEFETTMLALGPKPKNEDGDEEFGKKITHEPVNEQDGWSDHSRL